LLRSHGKDFGIRKSSTARDVIRVRVGQQDRSHGFASQAHLPKPSQNCLRLRINEDHLPVPRRDESNRNHAVLHLNRSSGKLLTVFQGDSSGEGIKDEAEDQGNEQENTYENNSE
jgi:hypothetical protein